MVLQLSNEEMEQIIQKENSKVLNQLENLTRMATPRIRELVQLSGSRNLCRRRSVWQAIHVHAAESNIKR